MVEVTKLWQGYNQACADCPAYRKVPFQSTEWYEKIDQILSEPMIVDRQALTTATKRRQDEDFRTDSQ